MHFDARVWHVSPILGKCIACGEATCRGSCVAESALHPFLTPYSGNIPPASLTGHDDSLKDIAPFSDTFDIELETGGESREVVMQENAVGMDVTSTCDITDAISYAGSFALDKEVL